MRILYAGSIVTQRSKGDTIHFLSLARALAARGHELSMVTQAPSDPSLAREFAMTDVDEVKISRIGQYFTDIRFFMALLRLGRNSKFDALYHRAIPLANLCARILRIPSITEVNGIQVDELRLNGMHPLRLQTFRYREQLTVKNAQKVICVTQGIQEQLTIQYGVDPARCVVIANATDTDEFSPQPKLDSQARLGLCHKNFNIGFVGRFQHWVDFDCLLEAIEQLSQKSERDMDQMDIDPIDTKPIRWTIVGDGPNFDAVQRQVVERNLDSQVNLPGHVPHELIPTWCSAFDLCIAPFTAKRNESIGVSPLKLYEYMACGCPVVATALPGITETLAQSEAGLTYPPGDVDALVKQVESLRTNPERCQTMGDKGRDYAIQNHSWRSVAERTEGVIKSLIESK